ncbi:MAG: GNAT family N-acetyltransferase [Deltaproteobacteria bacterium]|nr:MAG: GNAT family N-acetyltransferase [Deltaproteobacteria bacterium]
MDRDELLLRGDLNYAEVLREEARCGGGSVIEEDGIVVTLAGHPHPLVNSALRMDHRIDAETCVDRIVNFYVPRGQGCTVILRAAVDDSDLGRAAAEAEMREWGELPAMVTEAPLERPATTDDCRLSWVDAAQTAEDFHRVAAEAWQTYDIPPDATDYVFGSGRLLLLPHVQAVVAYTGDSPAAAAFVLMSHEIAGVYWVSTIPAARGRGLAAACTQAVTNRAFELGARAVCLQASPMGRSVYERLGFSTIGSYRLMIAFPQE